MNELIDRLVGHVRLDDSLFEMRDSGKPIFIYGAAEAGKYLLQYLRKKEIPVRAFLVDDEYETGSSSKSSDLEIMPLSTAISDFDDINLVIGFYRNHLIDFIDEKISRIQKANVKVRYVAPDLSLVISPERIIDSDFIKQNRHGFLDLHERLADQISKDTLLAYLSQRMTGTIGFLEPYICEDQYFPRQIIELSDSEVFVDCGAFDGDTVDAFIRMQDCSGKGPCRAIYAFEPDNKNFALLQAKFGGIDKFSLYNSAVWSHNAILGFDGGQEQMSAICPGGSQKVSAVCLDDILIENAPTFIKFDIQGAEFAALIGAIRVIKRGSPKLSICVYHRPEDLLVIPKFLTAMNPSYRLYLRAHESKSAEVVLYAVTGK